MSASDVPQSTPTATAEEFPFGDLPSMLNPKTVLKSDSSLRDAGGPPVEMLVAPSSLIGRLFPQLTDAAQDPQLLAPARAAGVELDYFTLQERIGMGAMGAVFRAQDNRLDRIVALKILSPTLARDPSVIQRFRQEAKATAQVDHENVAKVFYIGENQGLHFIVYEFVEGRNIRDILQERGKLQPEDALNYVLQIAHALSAMWRVKVVHRDIKPSNILITPTGRAKLVDLGLARIKNPDSTATDLTEIGTTLGTFDYISPEQAKDPRSVDVRSDIYSLGCTLYHMLTGSPPYPEGTLFQKLLNHQKQKPPNPANRNPRVSKDFVALTQRMMSANPSRRPVNAEILIQELAGIARSYGLQAVHPGSVVWVQPEPLRENFWTKHFGIIASVCILGAIIVGVDRYGDDVQPHVFPNQSGPGFALPDEKPAPEAAPPNQLLAATEESFQPRTLLPEQSEGIAHPGASPFASPPAPPLDDSPTLALFESLFPSFTLIPPDSPLVNPPADLLPTKNVPPTNVPEPVKPVASPESTPPPPVASVWEITLLKPDNSRATFATLEAACAAAADESVILLKYNGRRIGAGGKPLLEKPLRINNKSLTIRGADGFRPVVEFGSRLSLQDQVQTRMIELNNSDLRLVNLDVSVETGEQFSADQWALISAREASQILLERTTVTFLNPTSQPAAVLEILPDSHSTDMKMMGNSPTNADPPSSVTFRQCFVRGDCNLVSLYDSRSRTVQVEQTILALDQNLLVVLGDVDHEPTEEASLELSLNHVTCALGRSLVRMDSGLQPARDLIPLRVSAENSIFACSNSGQPLVQMEGGTNVQDFRRLLRQWAGLDNFVEYRFYWAIATPDGNSPAPFLEDDWRRHWLSVPGSSLSPSRAGEVRWASAWMKKSLSTLLPLDLELDSRDGVANPALTSSRDGSNAGANLKATPVPPDFAQPIASRPMQPES